MDSAASAEFGNANPEKDESNIPGVDAKLTESEGIPNDRMREEKTAYMPRWKNLSIPQGSRDNLSCKPSTLPLPPPRFRGCLDYDAIAIGRKDSILEGTPSTLPRPPSRFRGCLDYDAIASYGRKDFILEGTSCTLPRPPPRFSRCPECDAIEIGRKNFLLAERPSTLPRPPRFRRCPECDAIENGRENFLLEERPSLDFSSLSRLPQKRVQYAEGDGVQIGGKDFKVEPKVADFQDEENLRSSQINIEGTTSELRDNRLDSENHPTKSTNTKTDTEGGTDNSVINAFKQGAMAAAFAMLILTVIFVFILLFLVVFFNFKIHLL